MTPRRSTKLPRWQEWAVYLSLSLLAATGIGWLVLDQWIRVAGDFGPEHHPAERWMLTVHGGSAYLFLIVIGALIPVHIQLGWRTRRNRASGATLATICLLLSVTALGLYYFGGDIARHWTSVVHWSVGLVVLPTLLIHAIMGRRGS